MVNEGDSVPNPAVETPEGKSVKLLDHAKAPFVVYFYPKDDTSGCTKEAQDFTTLAARFAKAGVPVIGISKDPPKKHRAFTEKYGLEVDLLSDSDGSACEAFGTWIEKSMYGRKYMGIDRATFLIGRDGRIARIWRKVKVPGHAEEVLAAATTLG